MSAGAFDADGWLQRARRITSPNCDARPAGSRRLAAGRPQHQPASAPVRRRRRRSICSATGSIRAPIPFYAGTAGVEVSSHFFIRRDGELIQFVPCGLRAWHAGASVWKGAQRCNDFSVGVELEGSDFVPFRDAQYQQLAQLTGELQAALSDPGHRRPQRHRARAQDRSRAFLRLGSLSLADCCDALTAEARQAQSSRKGAKAAKGTQRTATAFAQDTGQTQGLAPVSCVLCQYTDPLAPPAGGRELTSRSARCPRPSRSVARAFLCVSFASSRLCGESLSA